MHTIPKQDSFLGIFAGLYKLPGLILENKGIHAVQPKKGKNVQ